MKKKEIVFILFIIVATIIIFICVGTSKKGTTKKETKNNDDTTKTSYVEEIENGIKINTSSKLNEAKEVAGYKISNIQLTTRDGITTLLADVKNTSNKKTELKTVEVTLLGENGEELTTIKGVISALDANESTQLNVSATSDYIQSYDFKVNVK